MDVETDEQRNAREAQPPGRTAGAARASLAELRDDERREQRDDGDEQSGGGAVERVSRRDRAAARARLISMTVNASSHFHLRNAGASALRCSATGSSSNEPMNVRAPATTSGSISPTAMRISR